MTFAIALMWQLGKDVFVNCSLWQLSAGVRCFGASNISNVVNNKSIDLSRPRVGVSCYCFLSSAFEQFQFAQTFNQFDGLLTVFKIEPEHNFIHSFIIDASVR